MSNVIVGAEVIAFWGATFPTQDGIITKIKSNGIAVIEFECSDDDDHRVYHHECKVSDIRETKCNGVGIYLLDSYMGNI